MDGLRGYNSSSSDENDEELHNSRQPNKNRSSYQEVTKSKWDKPRKEENTTETRDKPSTLSPEEAASRIMDRKNRYSSDNKTQRQERVRSRSPTNSPSFKKHKREYRKDAGDRFNSKSRSQSPPAQQSRVKEDAGPMFDEFGRDLRPVQRQSSKDDDRTKNRSQTPERIVNKFHSQSPERITNKLRSQSPERSAKKSYRQSPEKIVNKRCSQSPEKKANKHRSQSPDRPANKRCSQSPDRPANKRQSQSDSPDRAANKCRSQSPEGASNKRRDSRDGKEHRDRNREKERRSSDADRKKDRDHRDKNTRDKQRDRNRDRGDRDDRYDRDRRKDRPDRDRRDRRRSRSRTPPLTRAPDFGRKMWKKGAAVAPLAPPSSEEVAKRLAVHAEQLKKKAEAQATALNMPSYLNPSVVNPQQYALQQQKRKLLWANKKKETDSTAWQATKFSNDQGGEMSAKFRRLMGIKGSEGEVHPSDQPQEDLLKNLELEFERSRVFQLSRGAGGKSGIGLGYSQQPGGGSV